MPVLLLAGGTVFAGGWHLTQPDAHEAVTPVPDRLEAVPEPMAPVPDLPQPVASTEATNRLAVTTTETPRAASVATATLRADSAAEYGAPGTSTVEAQNPAPTARDADIEGLAARADQPALRNSSPDRTQSPEAVLNYYNSGYISAGRERIQAALHAGDAEVIHISNAGDEIRISRGSTAAAAPTGSASGATPRRHDQVDETDNAEPDLNQDPEQPHMATANCPGALPQDTSEGALRSMTQNYGCRYLLTCRLSNDGNDQVLCSYTFAGVNG